MLGGEVGGFIEETDVIREHNSHLCACLNNKSIQKNYHFVKNFKILFIKEHELLYSNPNLTFNIDEESDIYNKMNDFVAEVSGIKQSNYEQVLK